MIMRLTENNIKRVRVHFYNSIPYCYHVTMKSGKVSDSREYINYYENGKTCIEEFKFEWLPVSVQNFMNHHIEKEVTPDNYYEHYKIFCYE